MTRDEITRMAREAGLMSVRMSKALEEIRFSQLDHFAALVAALVAAAEREACANVCDDLMAPPRVGGLENAVLYHDATEDCAAAIRARSKT